MRQKLQSTDLDERALWMARVMREVRYQDVFRWLRLTEVLELWSRIDRHLGRSRPFWHWLIEGWRTDGLIGGSVVRLRTAPEFQRMMVQIGQ